MARAVASLLVAVLLVACGRANPYTFEPGSADAIAADLVARWGGFASDYRPTLESSSCDRLAQSEVHWLEEIAIGVPDTSEWREAKGSLEAVTIRQEQLGCEAM